MSIIERIANNEIIDHSTSSKEQIKLISAIINGYEVEKDKLYVLPMEDTKNVLGHKRLACIRDGNWDVTPKDLHILPGGTAKVTQAQIDSAPDWVKAIKPVEVEADGNSND